jgi:hypothetical protein
MKSTKSVKPSDLNGAQLRALAKEARQHVVLAEAGADGSATSVRAAFCPLAAMEPVMQEVGGSLDDTFNSTLFNGVANATMTPAERTSIPTLKSKTAATLTAMAGVAPKDEIEGMLAAQLWATHSAAIGCHRAAVEAGANLEIRRLNTDAANKFSRTYATLVDTLMKYRGKGGQVVRVEHVHVYQGGQAIVGAVSPGSSIQVEGQAHAQLPYATVPPMPGQNPQGIAVPVAQGPRKEAVPNARRRARKRRAIGK